jgi:DNA invertase Pin-like site-specific DNA recombinase
MTEKITPRHLARKAMLYVRQSSLHQVVHNEESRRLQYEMRQRLGSLGWKEVVVVDEDLGRSATTTADRTGFQRMVAEVCLGKVGAVAAREVSRFARNNRDWHQLVEMCSLVDTLLVDQEAVYDPRQANDRLLLGLKGSMSEYELDLLRQRSLDARRAKAKRGELVISAPVGFVKTPDQRLEKDPDLRVQRAIRLVFDKFFELGSARQTLHWFVEHGVDLPSRSRSTTGTWETAWRRPAYPMVIGILGEPTYAGTYAYGRTEVHSRVHDGVVEKTCVRKPLEQWSVLIPEHHEGYISWQDFKRIDRMLGENTARFGQPGAAKRGAALLGGLLRCRRCGRRLMVNYTGLGRAFPRYCCHRAQMDNAEPACISFGGLNVDAAVSREVLRVVQPCAVEASAQAVAEESRRHDEVMQCLLLELKAARYEAERARKQYDAVDPGNRLVADELERRWNTSLEKVRAVEVRLEQARAVQAGPSVSPSVFMDLHGELERAWNDSTTDARLKKRILRTLIEDIIVDIDEAASEVELVLHWKGGVHSTMRVQRRQRGQHAAQTSKGITAAVRALALVCDDEVIASCLNRSKMPTAKGNRWTRERVASLRSTHEIPRHSEERQREGGWLTLSQAAAYVDVASATLRRQIEAGSISAMHPVSHGPWIFQRRELDSIATRLPRRHEPAAVPQSQLALEIPRT